MRGWRPRICQLWFGKWDVLPHLLWLLVDMLVFPRRVLHPTQILRTVEGRDLRFWTAVELKAWLTEREVDFEGWVNKSDLEDKVAETRGTSPNWFHLPNKIPSDARL